ncbi:sensor histidine kinase [Georgenia daeguensis]|uniref:histidine kinase n=1 Tax=Georgenia daeguensis TaxID=908355 RepID=A0ABP8EST1_9MICO
MGAAGVLSARAPAPRTQGDHLSIFVRQLPFAAVTLAIILAVAIFDNALLGDDRFFAAVVLTVVATALSLLLPWSRLPRWSTVVVPVMDICAVAFAEAAGFESYVLVLLPALWMATRFGRTGVVISIGLGTAAAWGPELLTAAEAAITDLNRQVLGPAVLTAAGIYLHLSEKRSTARRTLLGRQSALIEETLRDARAQQLLLGGILNTIDVGVVAMDAHGRVTHINRAHARVIAGRYRVGDPVDVHAGIDGYRADGVTPLGHDGSPLVRASRGETIDRELTIWEETDGSRRAFRVSAAPLLDEDGNWAGAVVAYQDLTAETSALAQREDFVSSVSHELRTPLTSILGYLELALEQPGVPESARAHLRVVQRNTERLQRLIGDLLTAAQTRAGEIALTAVSVDLREVVAEAVQSQSPRAASRGVVLENLATEPCVVHGDRIRLNQVTDNLVSNAIKYTERGGTVTLTLGVEGDEAHLSVRDTGIGISADDQEHIFDRFYRASSVRSGNVPGTGLGLHISRQLVEAHGGRIELTSATGKGTTMDVYLPRERR